MLIRLKFIFYSIYHRLSTVFVLQVFLRPNFIHSSMIKIIFLFRYGTTTYTLPPYKVLHTDLIGSDAIKLKAAVQSEDKPMAIVIPHESMPPAQAKVLLTDAGLWYI